MDRTTWARLPMIAVGLGYVVIILLSHYMPLPSFLEVPLAAAGWLFLPGLYVWARLRRIDTRPGADTSVRGLIRPWALTATFGGIAAVGLFLALGWEVPSFCRGPLNCVQGYQWSTDNGRYYHSIHEGTQVEISRQAYIQEVGIDLRSAAAFGLVALCLAWLAAAALRRPSQRSDAPRGARSARHGG